MPIYPPRELEPYKKKELLLKREKQLIHAIKNNFELAKITKAAQKVKEAQLKILKSLQQIASPYRGADLDNQKVKHLEKIEIQKKNGFQLQLNKL